MHREPRFLEVEAQVGTWLDCSARITSKELAPIHSVKSGTLQSACSTSQKKDADLVKSALAHTARLTNSLARSLERMVTKVQWPCWKGMSSLKEQGDLFRTLTHQVHDNCVAYFRIWSRWSLHRFCGRAQTYWSQSDVFNSQKPWYVMLTFETRIHRLEWFAQVIFISATPMLQNLRIGHRKRRNDKSDVPVKQCGGWPKISSN